MKEDILNYSPTVLFSWDTLYIKPELLLERKKRSDLEAKYCVIWIWLYNVAFVYNLIF